MSTRKQSLILNDVTNLSGVAWSTKLPINFSVGDSVINPEVSNLVVYEDGKILGPAHCLHQYIGEIGLGAFSHWGEYLLFSSSDNSDPRSNGRSYSVEMLSEIEMMKMTLDTFPEHFFPKIVGIETINTCNAKCPFCPLFQGGEQMDRSLRKALIMDDELFHRIINEIKEWQIKPLTMFLNMNGEPFQDPKISNRLSTIKEAGMGNLFCIQTNAQFLKPDYINALLDAGIGEVAVGFDGATKEVYESHRVRCNYETVLNNIKTLAEVRDKGHYNTGISIKYVRTRNNEKEVVLAYNLFNKFLSPELDKFEDTLSVDWSDTDTHDPMYYISKSTSGLSPKGCSVFNDQFIVLSDGLLAACCWDYNLNVSDGGFGFVQESTLLGTWRSKKRVAMLKELYSGNLKELPNKCLQCPNLFETNEGYDAKPMINDERMITNSSGYTYRFSKELR